MKKWVVLAACVALACAWQLGERRAPTTGEQLERARAALADDDAGTARELAGQVVAREPRNGVAWALRAEAQCMAGDTDGALVSLEQAMQHGVRDFHAFAANHHLDPVRATPQYQLLLRHFHADPATGARGIDVALPKR